MNRLGCRCLRLVFLLVLVLGGMAIPIAGAGLVAQAAGSCNVSSIADSGAGTLREALTTPACSAITFNAGLGTISVTSPLPTVTNTVSITGPATLQTGGQAFEVGAGGQLTLVGLTLDGSSVQYSYGVTLATATSSLTVIDSIFTGFYTGVNAPAGGTATITNSTITGTGVSGNYGLLFNAGGTATITNSIIKKYEMGVLFSNGGGTATVTNCNFTGNKYGLYLSNMQTADMATIANSTFSGTGNGYGVAFSGTGTLRVTNSTFSGNSEGMYFFSGGPASISNSTFSGNTLFGLAFSNMTGAMSVTNSTFSNNGRGLHFRSTATGAEVTNNTFSGNTVYGLSLYNGGAANVSNSLFAKGGGVNCSQILTTQTYNLADDASCFATGQQHSQVVAVGGAGLAPAGLADNGGHTQTIALLPGSPAIDAGKSTICAATLVNYQDQRGYIRPADAACDLGAFEYGATAQRFTDVPPDYWTYTPINQLALSGVTIGCGNGSTFCPERSVTRAEMAVFLSRVLGHPNGSTATSRFTDVPATHWAAPYIAEMVVLNITQGCTATTFCPNQPVTRAEMAVFLLRALQLSELRPSTPSFVDVATSNWAYGAIERLKAQGVTQGMYQDGAGLHYRPTDPVSRAQMAVFLRRAWP